MWSHSPKRGWSMWERGIEWVMPKRVKRVIFLFIIIIIIPNSLGLYTWSFCQFFDECEKSNWFTWCLWGLEEIKMFLYFFALFNFYLFNPSAMQKSLIMFFSDLFQIMQKSHMGTSFTYCISRVSSCVLLLILLLLFISVCTHCSQWVSLLWWESYMVKQDIHESYYTRGWWITMQNHVTKNHIIMLH